MPIHPPSPTLWEQERVSGPAGIASLVGGLVVTAAIFAWLAQRGGTDEEAPVWFNDTQAVVLPDPPPPPLIEELPERVEPAISHLLMLAEERTGGDFLLPAAPIIPDFVPESRGLVRFDLSLGALKPSVAPPGTEVRRIFDRSEVDEPPRAVFKKTPRLTDAMTKPLKIRRLRFLFVVNFTGGIEQIRLLASTGDAVVDALCTEAMKQWKFTPAVRQGRKVRCWVEQGFNIRTSTKSPFES